MVTIIVPVYNVEKYLNECVDSLRNQTYEDIEIILVDDGSKDNCGVICDEYAALDSRIRVIHKQNEGLGFARNTGLKAAKGDFVTFIDSDDVADKDLIEKLVKGISESDCDTCIGGFKRISEDGDIKFVEQYKEAIVTNENVYDGLFARMLGSATDRHDAIKMSVWNVMYSMNIIREHNLEFPSEREFISEDIVWDSDYYKYARRVKLINSTAYKYRITPGSLTQKYKPDMLEKICILYNELCKRIDYDEKKVIRLQRQFLVNLRVCIRQESKSISKKKRVDAIKSIKRILNNEIVHNVAVQYEKLIKQKKQKLFVSLVKYKLAILLFLLTELGIL